MESHISTLVKKRPEMTLFLKPNSCAKFLSTSIEEQQKVFWHLKLQIDKGCARHRTGSLCNGVIKTTRTSDLPNIRDICEVRCHLARDTEVSATVGHCYKGQHSILRLLELWIHPLQWKSYILMNFNRLLIYLNNFQFKLQYERTTKNCTAPPFVVKLIMNYSCIMKDLSAAHGSIQALLMEWCRNALLDFSVWFEYQK